LLFAKAEASDLSPCPEDQNKRFHNCFGTYTWADGNKYIGEWKNDKWHGQGTYTWADGDKYVGEWRDGKRHGQGTYTIANGNKYVGEWRDDTLHGQGTYTWASGNKYVGEWKNNKRHGQGTYTWASGRVKEGIWENDEYQGTEEEYEKILKNRKRAAEKLEAEKRAAKLAAERHKAELQAALVRCLYEDLDRITSDTAEKIVIKKCHLELQDLSTEDLMEAYD
tara:strand:- start:15 stop:683 length:669 start_codon:yes stop_codon:yes gene_type:complete